MSLVGPRPLLEEYLPFYTDYQMRRHDVRPGITGWAQINGRNSITWEEKFNLDIWYIENQSFKLDIKILLLTTFKILKEKVFRIKNMLQCLNSITKKMNKKITDSLIGNILMFMKDL